MREVKVILTEDEVKLITFLIQERNQIRAYAKFTQHLDTHVGVKMLDAQIELDSIKNV